MSEDKKETQEQEIKRGSRGPLGEGTPGSRLKALWHDQPSKTRPASLKAFVRSLTDNPDAKVWLENKAGKNQQGRSEANLKRAREESQATRTAKRKRSAGGK